MMRQYTLLSILLFTSFFTFGQDRFADVIIDTYYSGSYSGFSDFYGELNGGPLGLIDPAVCLGDNSSFVCLSKDSYITVGFEDNFIFDAPGQDDLFIEEVGGGNEFADVYLSSDHGQTFTYYGQINGGGNTGIDLNDIGFTGYVNAVKLVGLDNNGGAPGFDFAKIYGVKGASCSADADVVLQDVCQDSIFNFTGKFDGYWESNLLIDSVLVSSDTGWLSLTHIVEDDVFGCPNDTAIIPIHVTPCDCQGTPYGVYVADHCNQCLLPTDSLFDACVDCAGVPFGESVMDQCGQCLLPTDSLFNDCLDCAGVPFGEFKMDRCEQCLLPSDPEFNSCVDCANVAWGDKVLDRCNQCLLETDSLFNNCLDCAGVPFGNAIVDLCEQCLPPTDTRICTEKTIFYFPNAFSPNSDGINDEFALITRDGVLGEVLEYSIFSRWGELVYQAKHFPTYSTDFWWDGKIKGRKARTGVYIYHVLIQLDNGKVLNYSGDITVVR